MKKGEKGILILAPIVRRKNESAEQNETDESSTAVGFGAAYVFDISQTDGQELPEIGSVNGDPCEYRERRGKFIAAQGIALEYSQDTAPTRGSTRLRKNDVPEDLERFWMGHEDEEIGDSYSKLRQDVEFRQAVAKKIGLGFELPSKNRVVGPNGPKIKFQSVQEMAASA